MDSDWDIPGEYTILNPGDDRPGGSCRVTPLGHRHADWGFQALGACSAWHSWHSLATFGRGSTAPRAGLTLAPKRFGAPARCQEILAWAMVGSRWVDELFRSGITGRSQGLPPAGGSAERPRPSPSEARAVRTHRRRARGPTTDPRTSDARGGSTNRMAQFWGFMNAPRAGWGHFLN